MRCEGADRLIEAFVSGDEIANDEFVRHVESCQRCTAAIEMARTVDRLLATPPPTLPPSGFSRSVVERLRADRWRAERTLDLGFNLAIAAGLLVVIGGVWLLLNVSGLNAVTQDVARIFADGMTSVAARVVTGLPTYSAAAGLVMTALGVWWWAERGFTTR